MQTHYEASIDGKRCGCTHPTLSDAFRCHATLFGGKADFIEPVVKPEADDRVRFSEDSDLLGTVVCYTGKGVILVKWDRCTAYGTWVNQRVEDTIYA